MLSGMITSIQQPHTSVDTARDNLIVGSDASFVGTGLAIVDTTPTGGDLSGTWADATYNSVGQTSTSGGGTGMVVTIVVSSNAPTFTVTDVGSGYSSGDTVVFTQPGGSATATITLEEASTNNVAIGKNALNSTTSLGQGADSNVAIGLDSLTDLTYGDHNIAIGHNSGANITTGESNISIGSYAGDGLTTANNNVAVGYAALSNNAGSDNTAVGWGAGMANTSVKNTFIGRSAADVCTGERNVVIGMNALGSGTDMDKVTVIGQEALYTANNNAADGTVAIGWAAGYYSAPTGDPTTGGNLLIGMAAGTDVSGADRGLTTGRKNIAIGQESLGANAGGGLTANQNTVMGYRAGYSLTGGDPDDNTFIGYRSGYSATTGTDNTLIGSDTALSAVGGDGQIAIGKGVTCIADNTATLGIGANTASLGLDGSDTSWAAASSDERLKENIQSCDVGLAFINDLRPVTYNWKKAKDVPKNMPQYVEGSEEPVLGFNYGTKLHGFIAQEVKEAIDKHEGIKDSFKMWQLKDDGTQTVADGAVIPMLVKAIQELSQQIEDLKKG